MSAENYRHGLCRKVMTIDQIGSKEWLDRLPSKSRPEGKRIVASRTRVVVAESYELGDLVFAVVFAKPSDAVHSAFWAGAYPSREDAVRAADQWNRKCP